MARRRTFAIVPAAGVSARMGAHKLLLPWGGATVIERVLAAWRASSVDHVIVVVRAAGFELATLCQAAGADVVITRTPTSDMKASVRLALDHIERQYQPTDGDAWLLAPADLPRLSAKSINAVVDAFDGSAQIVVPVFRGRRGHPTLFGWPLADRIARLRPDLGINALVAHHQVHEVPWPDDSILRDVDTPEEYAAGLANAWES